MMKIALDIGCGSAPGNPFKADIVYGIDINEDTEKNVIGVDLILDPIPFGDNFFDFIVASHILEHIPRIIYNPIRRQPFIELMNEIWRILKHDGIFASITPAFPHPESFQDPTHVNFITEKTFTDYFLKPNGYGFVGSFELVQQAWQGYNLTTILKKSSPLI